MSEKRKIKAQKREQKQKRQAVRVVNGIFIGLIAIMLICLVIYAVVAS